MMNDSLRLKLVSETPTASKPFFPHETVLNKGATYDLGHGSHLLFVPRFLPLDLSWEWFDYLNKHIPWTRPTLVIFNRSSIQPRDSCYVASEGLPQMSYSGHQPHAYSWDDFPPLKDILETVHKALPESKFNSLVLNRYKGGNDYVSWHSDDESAYGPTPEIGLLTIGCKREFLLKKKPNRMSKGGSDDEPTRKKLRTTNGSGQQHGFTLKHGSLFVMRGYVQRDWLHSVPKRAKAMSARINLTFRRVIC